MSEHILLVSVIFYPRSILIVPTTRSCKGDRVITTIITATIALGNYNIVKRNNTKTLLQLVRHSIVNICKCYTARKRVNMNSESGNEPYRYEI